MTHPPRDTQTSSDLSFKPLDEGLGFHPFSDGLPYAPVPPAARPPSRPAAPVRPSQTPRSSALRPPPSASVSSVQLRPSSSFTHAKTQESTPDWTILVRRLGAWLLDSTLHVSICFVLFAGAAWKMEIPIGSLSDRSVFTVTALFLVFFNWSLTTAQDTAFGTSLGKRFFQLHLEGSGRRVLARSFLYWLSVATGGLGFLWAVFDPQYRTLHDRLSGVSLQEIAQL